jgi:NAD(P)-dependent dehydrogenase (short-subunit alcohol dehydrogenase family)
MLNGKTAIITGTSIGIGKGIAINFAKHGVLLV